MYRLTTAGSIQRFVTEILSAFESGVRSFILDVARRFIAGLQIPIIRQLERIFPADDVLVVLMRWVTMTLKDFEIFGRVLNLESLSAQEIGNIFAKLESQFRCWFTDFAYDVGSRTVRKENRRRGNVVRVKKCCPDCDGYYYVTPKVNI